MQQVTHRLPLEQGYITVQIECGIVRRSVGVELGLPEVYRIDTEVSDSRYHEVEQSYPELRE